MKLFVAIPIILLILVFLVQSSLTEKMELMQVRENFFGSVKLEFQLEVCAGHFYSCVSVWNKIIPVTF